MQKTIHHQAEDWMNLQASACLLLITGFLWFLAPNPAMGQQPSQPMVSIIGFPSFTPENTIRCAEGELVLFWGENPVPIQPEVWQSPKPGQVIFTVQDQQTQLHFDIDFAYSLSAFQAAAGVTVNCTASRISSQPSNPVVWCAWRHQPVKEKAAFGVVLSGSVQSKIEKQSHPDPWLSTLTWHFHHNAYCRENFVLYWLSQTEGWDVSHYVRLPQPPYTSFEPSSLSGWTKLSAAIKANQTSSMQIVIPYLPIDIPLLALDNLK